MTSSSFPLNQLIVRQPTLVSHYVFSQPLFHCTQSAPNWFPYLPNSTSALRVASVLVLWRRAQTEMQAHGEQSYIHWRSQVRLRITSLSKDKVAAMALTDSCIFRLCVCCGAWHGWSWFVSKKINLNRNIFNLILNHYLSITFTELSSDDKTFRLIL